jgi:hypothetical protein
MGGVGETIASCAFGFTEDKSRSRNTERDKRVMECSFDECPGIVLNTNLIKKIVLHAWHGLKRNDW